jgi:hypothetical protein
VEGRGSRSRRSLLEIAGWGAVGHTVCQSDPCDPGRWSTDLAYADVGACRSQPRGTRAQTFWSTGTLYPGRGHLAGAGSGSSPWLEKKTHGLLLLEFGHDGDKLVGGPR